MAILYGPTAVGASLSVENRDGIEQMIQSRKGVSANFTVNGMNVSL